MAKRSRPRELRGDFAVSYTFKHDASDETIVITTTKGYDSARTTMREDVKDRYPGTDVDDWKLYTTDD